MRNIVAFYEITLTNSLGCTEFVYVIGTEKQVIDYAINETVNYGLTYSIQLMNSHSFEGNILNLCNK